MDESAKKADRLFEEMELLQLTLQLMTDLEKTIATHFPTKDLE